MTTTESYPANIVLSAPSGTDGVRTWMFTTRFDPPMNVKGKKCILKVYNVGIQRFSPTHVDLLSTYSLSISSFNQPYGYQSLNSPTGYEGQTLQASAPTSTSTQTMGFTNIVAILTTAGLTGTTEISNDYCKEHPDILVSVPHTTHDVTVRLQKIGGVVGTGMGSGLEQLTVGFTLTPLE